jgi:hypothetical protein
MSFVGLAAALPGRMHVDDVATRRRSGSCIQGAATLAGTAFGMAHVIGRRPGAPNPASGPQASRRATCGKNGAGGRHGAILKPIRAARRLRDVGFRGQQPGPRLRAGLNSFFLREWMNE